MLSRDKRRAVRKIWNLVVNGVVVDELILFHKIRDLGLVDFFSKDNNRFWDRVLMSHSKDIDSVYFVDYKGSLAKALSNKGGK